MIYLIDDDDIQNLINQRMVELVMPELPIKVFIGGESAMDDIRSEDESLPGVIFLDINMPRMSGWDFMDLLEPMNLKIPVYIVTSSINKQDQEKSRTYASVKGFISKPVTKETIAEILNETFS